MEHLSSDKFELTPQGESIIDAMMSGEPMQEDMQGQVTDNFASQMKDINPEIVTDTESLDSIQVAPRPLFNPMTAIEEPAPTAITEPYPERGPTMITEPMPEQPPMTIVEPMPEPASTTLVDPIPEPIIPKEEQGIKTMYVGASPEEHGAFDPLFDKSKTRKEINDSVATIDLDNFWKLNKNHIGPLRDLLDHPELFAQYPDLEDIEVQTIAGESDRSAYNPFTDRIELSYLRGQEGARSSLLHELQHAIQEREGWTRGGSPEQFKYNGKEIKKIDAELEKLYATPLSGDEDLGMEPRTIEQSKRIEELEKRRKEIFDNTPQRMYERLAGEVEARDTAARRNLELDIRDKIPPYSGQKIPLKKMLIQDESGTVQYPMAENAGSEMRKLWRTPSRMGDKGARDTWFDMKQGGFGEDIASESGDEYLPYNVKFDNPLKVKTTGDAIRKLFGSGKVPKLAQEYLDSEDQILEDGMEMAFDDPDAFTMKLDNILTKTAREKGYDGIIFKERGPVGEAVAFNSNNINAWENPANKNISAPTAKGGEIENRYPIIESDQQLARRQRSDRPRVVEVDAKWLKDQIEKTTGEKLGWSPERLKSALEREYSDAYPYVELTKRGWDVTDGGHRIAAAAEKGQTIGVAVEWGDAGVLKRNAGAKDIYVQNSAREGDVTDLRMKELPSKLSPNEGK